MQELSLNALRSFSGVGSVEVTAPTTALLIVDMQNAFVHREGFTIRRLLDRGLDAAVEQYERQLRAIIPNLRLLIDHARTHGQSILFVNFVSYEGRQAGGQPTNQWIEPDSEDAHIIAELGRRPEDLLLSKGCSGAFAGTNLEFHLRRRGISSLIVGGIVTDGCVEQVVRHAHDLGYSCVLPSDGCGALTDEIHLNAIERLEHRRAHVRSTDTIIATRVIQPTDIPTVGTSGSVHG